MPLDRRARGRSVRSPETLSRRHVLGAYVALTKPRIIELLLVTTLPVMVLAARGVPDLWTLLVTLVGGTLAAGSANTINCVVDRDIDAVMVADPAPADGPAPGPAGRGAAVRHRPRGRRDAAARASAQLAVGGARRSARSPFYVFVYTLGLKRRTPSNIVIGGAAGCFPVLIGWSAVRGDVGWPAVVLFAVVFLWTPPHFWALAMRFKDDYAAAGVPMLPVVASAVGGDPADRPLLLG